MTYTDTQLRRALCSMLPDGDTYYAHAMDTELLHLCWLVEARLDEPIYYGAYQAALCDLAHTRSRSATWQQRVIALAKVKDVEIV